MTHCAQDADLNSVDNSQSFQQRLKIKQNLEFAQKTNPVSLLLKLQPCDSQYICIPGRFKSAFGMFFDVVHRYRIQPQPMNISARIATEEKMRTRKGPALHG
jgi:hypothetical protein